MSEVKAKKQHTATPQQLEAADPMKSIWVSANAGSGKTQVLVERVIRLLLKGADPASILCITYTKAAAAEMSSRLFKRLGSWTALGGNELAESLYAMGADGGDAALVARARRLFTAALETPGGLKIQTIHAFCERLLHLFPVEAGIAPGFRVMDERETREMQDSATRHVLQLAESGAEQQLAASFSRLAERLSEDQFDELIRSFVDILRKWTGALLTRATYQNPLNEALGLAGDLPEEWATIDQASYLHHAEQLRPHGTFRKIDVAGSLGLIARASDGGAALLKFFFTKALEPRKEFMAAKTRDLLPGTETFLKQEQARLQAALCRSNTRDVISASTDALILASAILARIENEKRETGRYDFSDLISRTARLLSSQRATQWVLFKLDPGLSHILLDEAQDTGPDQWVMIDALAQEFFAGMGREQKGERTLFVVGDRKQSIYSFQGADVSAYATAEEQFLSDGRLRKVNLDISYRSTAEVLSAVDRVFTDSTHTPSRIGDQGLVEIWPLVEADEDADEEPWTKPVDRPPQSSPQRKLARQIASMIAGWLDDSKPRMLIGKNRRMNAGDVLILFRSRGSLFRMVLAELRALRVPVAGADRLDLLKSLIVQDVQMLLQWLLLPDDDHALAVILKSPLVPQPLTEEELFHLAYDRKETPLYQRLVGKNREWLEGLQSRATADTPFALLTRIFNISRKAIMARLGSEAIEASDAMLDLALNHEQEHGPSLFGFTRWFASTETTIRRELEQASGEARLMTVHGAKGLEAPVVILADAKAMGGGSNSRQVVLTLPKVGLPLWIPSGSKPYLPELDTWVEADKAKAQAESGRLLYVAMTRAADELYVFGQARKKSSEESWWDIITKSLGEPAGDKPLRFGPESTFAKKEIDQSRAAPVIPQWMIKAAFSEQLAASLALTTAMSGAKNYDPAAAKRGRSVHKLLEELADLPAERRAVYAKSRAAKLGLQQHEAMQLAEALSAPALQPFLGPESRGEVDIAGELPDGREVSGRIDRLTVSPESIWLIDYKTDRYVPDIVLQAHPYARQLAGYAALMQAAYPSHVVNAAIYWTEKARVDILPETVLTAALQLRDDPES